MAGAGKESEGSGCYGSEIFVVESGAGVAEFGPVPYGMVDAFKVRVSVVIIFCEIGVVLQVVA